MHTKRTLAYGLIAMVILGATNVYAQPKPPGSAAVEHAVTHPAETLKKVTPPLPEVKATPPKLDTAPSATVTVPGVVSTEVHGDPLKPVPDTHLEPQMPLANELNKANDTIQGAQNKAEEEAKKVAAFPLEAAKAALDLVGNAAKDAIKDIVTTAKTAIDAQLQALWAEYQWKVYIAGGALFAILMLPALIAAWLVRRIGRRRERRMEAALDQAMKVIRAYAKEAGVKIPV